MPLTSENIINVDRTQEEQFTLTKAQKLNLEYVNFAITPADLSVLINYDYDLAKSLNLIPFILNKNELAIATNDPNNFDHLTQLSIPSEFKVKKFFCSASSLSNILAFWDEKRHKTKDNKLHYYNFTTLEEVKSQLRDLQKPDEIFHFLLQAAGYFRASDLHIEPFEQYLAIRFRIDGDIQELARLDLHLATELIGTIKFKAKMPINVNEKPLDGRFNDFISPNERVDLRVSTIPSHYGETMVIRILHNNKIMTLQDLGIAPRNLSIIKRALHQNVGMIITSGPTGSGKTTLLYSLLNRIDKEKNKIITLEDPIEYSIDGIIQSQISQSRGYDFVAGIRALLRQDPNIMMVGEIRDLETAKVAMNAANTGHLLFSTIHTNTAVDVISRLVNMGMKNYEIAPALSLIIGQRLAHKICPHCQKQAKIAPAHQQLLTQILNEIKKIDETIANDYTIPDTLATSTGCTECNGTGELGQIGLHEVFLVDDKINKAILDQKSTLEITTMLRTKGYLRIYEDAALKVLDGTIHIKELLALQ